MDRVLKLEEETNGNVDSAAMDFESDSEFGVELCDEFDELDAELCSESLCTSTFPLS